MVQPYTGKAKFVECATIDQIFLCGREGCGLDAVGDKLGMKSCYLIPAAQFGLWFFAFMLLESFVNSSVVALIGAQSVNVAYSVGIFCTATGLLVFGLAHAKRVAWCRGAFSVAAAVCFVAVLGVTFARDAALLMVFSCIALLTCGFLGGRVHLGAARTFGDGSVCGRVLGVTTGFVVCVQFLVQNFFQGPVPVVVCVLTSIAVLALLNAWGKGFDFSPDTNTAARTHSRTWPQDAADKRRHGIFLVIAAAILTVIFSLNDSVVVALDASGGLELFSGIRLFYALGLVVAGCLFDLGPRFSFTFTTVAVQMLAVLVPYLLWTPEWYNLNMALFYFYGGFYVMFITTEFMVFCSQIRSQALWAGLGRTTRSYVTALSVIPISLLYASFGVVSLVVLGVVLNMALLAVCVVDAQLLVRCCFPELQADKNGYREATVVDFNQQDVEQFAQEVGLTDRERDVLALMVTTEDENQKMANDLNISRRTLQRHIAHIYEKAGVQSRIGLYKSVSAYVVSQRS